MGTSKSRQSVFRFKQFEVANSLSAMKVGTDGVLLGAWADVTTDGLASPRVLDVGTGTGLIALMLAQRFPTASITAIDIEPDAVAEARLNADRSPWGERIDVQLGDFCEFTALHSGRYDAVVSNPPYFTSTLKSDTRARMLARHGEGLDYATLIHTCANGLLAPGGTLTIVSPADREADITFAMELSGLRLTRLTRVFTKPTAQTPTRLLWAMTIPTADSQPTSPIIDTLLIGSPDYKALTGDFYL